MRTFFSASAIFACPIFLSPRYATCTCRGSLHAQQIRDVVRRDQASRAALEEEYGGIVEVLGDQRPVLDLRYRKAVAFRTSTSRAESAEHGGGAFASPIAAIDVSSFLIGSSPFASDGALIHEARVVVADLLRVGALPLLAASSMRVGGALYRLLRGGGAGA